MMILNIIAMTMFASPFFFHPLVQFLHEPRRRRRVRAHSLRHDFLEPVVVVVVVVVVLPKRKVVIIQATTMIYDDDDVFSSPKSLFNK